MYDRDWARSILHNYEKLCTRAQQINLCLQQFYLQQTGRNCTIADIQGCLIDSIQGKTAQKLWTMYKRLVKKTPLDKDLLEKVAKTMAIKVDVEKLQRQFDFT